MARRATAQDVADLAGVSRSAVSLTLNGRADGNIAAAKQTAIREAARQLRYTPNAIALSLRKQQTHTLGVLTWSGRAGLPLSLLGAVNAAANQAGYLLLNVNVRRRPELVDTLLDRRVDGFVVVAPDLGSYTAPDALAALPTVLINCFDDLLALTSLVGDEIGAGRTAARRLLRAGHTRIGVLADAGGGVQSERRLAGIRAELAEDGLPEPRMWSTTRDIEGGHRAARAVLSVDDPPTALIATHERLAVGAVLAAAALGCQVPDDLSMISLDDGEDLAGELVPRLTVVRRPDAALASYGVDTLVEMVRLGVGPARQLSFVCEVVEGDSVRPAGPGPMR